jgi:hypothetical protein
LLELEEEDPQAARPRERANRAAATAIERLDMVTFCIDDMDISAILIP